jgi:hypothetical protein
LRQQITYSEQEVKALVAESAQLNRDLRVTVAKMKGNQRRLISLNAEMNLISRVSDYSYYFGVLLAIIGFLLWYTRIQKPLDERQRITQPKDKPNKESPAEE